MHSTFTLYTRICTYTVTTGTVPGFSPGQPRVPHMRIIICNTICGRGQKVQTVNVYVFAAPPVNDKSKTKNVNEYMYNINHDHNELN